MIYIQQSNYLRRATNFHCKDKISEREENQHHHLARTNSSWAVRHAVNYRSVGCTTSDIGWKECRTTEEGKVGGWGVGWGRLCSWNGLWSLPWRCCWWWDCRLKCSRISLESNPSTTDYYSSCFPEKKNILQVGSHNKLQSHTIKIQ